jgi:uncharacterized protein YbjT (DUF2867 family)
VILITGATRASRSAVIREFARHHLPVRALVRSASKARELEELPMVDIWRSAIPPVILVELVRTCLLPRAHR